MLRISAPLPLSSPVIPIALPLGLSSACLEQAQRTGLDTEIAGPSVTIRTPVTSQAELPEETPLSSRTMVSAPAIHRTTIATEGETQARNSDGEDDVKVAKPPQYDGSPKKFRTWWVQMRNYIEMQPHKIKTDQANVGMVLSYM